jgi:predicted N-formylglutamate amidohydrolase
MSSAPRMGAAPFPDAAPRILLSCEHASHAVPREFAATFRTAPLRAALRSHRGWDPGAAGVARELARQLRAPLHEGRNTRLLVDLNRSPHHPRALGAWARTLPAAARRALLTRWHAPWRRAFARRVRAAAAGGRAVLHVSVHSFTPVLDGARRAMHVGLLYDPSRPAERALALALRRELRTRRPDLVVALNRPYQGRADGHVTALRRVHAPTRYRGIEIETRHDLLRGVAAQRAFGRLYAEALRAALTPRARA